MLTLTRRFALNGSIINMTCELLFLFSNFIACFLTGDCIDVVINLMMKYHNLQTIMYFDLI